MSDTAMENVNDHGLMEALTEKPQIPLDRYKLLQIIQAMGDAVLVFTPQGEVQLCNPAMERIVGMSQDQLVGQTLHHVFKTFAPELADVIRDLIATGESFSQEVTLYQHHQKRAFLLYTIPIQEAGVLSEGVAVFHDITQIKQTEKMRRDFVANVSHELRTPLSAIHGYAETLLEGALEDEAVAKDFVQIIFNHAKRLSQLVQDLLDLSKLEASEGLELQPVALMPIIEKIIQLSQKDMVQKQIRLQFHPPADFPLVLAHSTSLEQVLTNLLDNAIKYTPAGGAMAVRVLQIGKMAQVEVEDTGIGIEAKHISRVFERFYRVDKARSRDLGGTGLGLSIVKHIIQSHGGEVWVDSKSGQGSTFRFTLQLAP